MDEEYVNTEIVVSSDNAIQKEGFGVTLQVRAKHTDLLRAARKLGGVKALAAHLGVHQSTMSGWVMLKMSPRFAEPRSRFYEQEARDTLAAKLWLLTGKELQEIWPDDVFTKDFLAIDKKAEFETNADVIGLASHQEHILRLPSPEKQVQYSEMVDLLKEAMTRLTAREQSVITSRFGLDGGAAKPYSEIGKELKVSVERARQIEMKALSKMLRNSNTGPLSEYADYVSKFTPEEEPESDEDVRP